MINTWAVVVAAGRGERFGRPYNKVLHRLSRGETVLSRTLGALYDSGEFEGLVLVAAERDMDEVREILSSSGRDCAGWPPVLVPGGETRQESVANGLAALPGGVELVAIHDAARPFITPSLIRELVRAAAEYGSAIPATYLTDTVKLVGEDVNYTASTPERKSLRAVQTPQVFRLEPLRAAYESYSGNATDDAEIYERHSGRVRIVMHPDCEINKKITLPEDAPTGYPTPPLPALSVGTGYDVHRLIEGRKLTLCGIEIPYHLGLAGHSDADVAVHALIDALLGGMGMGDIGRHFPDSEQEYKDISSMLLLRRVAGMMAGRGTSVMSADITIVAERPKLAPHIAAMAESIRAALPLMPGASVNVKATTTEGMGPEGEGLSISAQAAVLIAKGGRDD